MRNGKIQRSPFLVPGLLLLCAGCSFAAEPKHEGLTRQAVEIARPLGFPISNSMFFTWIVAAGLIILAGTATRDMKRVPDRLQNFLEWLIESLYGFLEGVIGPHLVKKTFWFFASIF